MSAHIDSLCRLHDGQGYGGKDQKNQKKTKVPVGMNEHLYKHAVRLGRDIREFQVVNRER